MKRPPETLGEVVPFREADLPLIRCTGGELPRVVDEAEAALLSAKAPVYSRGPMLVTPAMASVPASDGREFLSPRLQVVTDVWLIEKLTSAARFEKFDARSHRFRSIDCPRAVAQTLLARESWRLPALAGIVSAPTLRGDGSPIETEGYDPRSRLILSFAGETFPPMAERPSQDDARRALAELEEAFSTFPVVENVDRAVIVSALLSALVRRSLPTTPLHGVTAHSAGTGKSLLVDVVAMIATGRPCAVTALGRTAEEFEKRLGAMLIAGDALISLDNIDQPLTGDFLAQVLTQEVVKVRVLGRSLMIETPSSAMIFATGNNLRVSGDLTRRCLVARLDPGCENPETRTFSRHAIVYARQNRGKLVIAALSIMRAYALAGRPAPLPTLGSYDWWSVMVREAIVWAGGADPVRSLDFARAGDPERESLHQVMWAWHSRFGDERTTVAKAIEEAGRSPALRLALIHVAGDRGEVDARRLGKWLARVADRLLGGARFVRDGERQGSALWRLVGFEGVEGSDDGQARERQ